MIEITKEDLIEQYVKNCKGVRATGQALKISDKKVRELLKKYDIPIKTGGRKKYFANDNFFSNWSSNMAYCLGFISADGHVWKDRPFFTIGIHERDVDVLTFIRDCISPSSPVRHSKDKVQICVHSQQIHQDLQKKYHINHNKTFNLKIDFDIPEEFWGDYLRGVFDGDGSIWETQFIKDGQKYYYGSIVSASRPFLDYIQKRLGFGVMRIVRGKYFELKFSQTNCLKLFDIIYKNQNCFKMQRKYEKFLKISTNYSFWTKEEDKVLEEFIKLDRLPWSAKKFLTKALPNRAYTAIKTRIQKIKHAT